jgi:hypothetical protein
MLAFGPGFVLANTAAGDVVAAVDHALLRSLGEPGDRTRRVVRLAGGTQARVQVERIGGHDDCVLVEIDAIENTVPHVHTGAPPPSPSGERLLLVGEPGTGRTTEALRSAGPGAVLHSAESVLRLGRDVWMRQIVQGLESGPFVLDDIDALAPELAGGLTRLLARTSMTAVLTAGTGPPTSPEHSALAHSCVARRTLPALRDRLDEIPELVRALTAAAGTPYEPSPSAVEALRAHDWPGNLHELQAVLAAATPPARPGELTVRDLPSAYRRTAHVRRLSRLESAERNAIVTALAESQGNIAQTARLLGISRPTLYSRIRALHIAR